MVHGIQLTLQLKRVESVKEKGESGKNDFIKIGFDLVAFSN